ncbi:MAG: hypothetical protein ACI8PZ_005655 [Myxococcota bacterium]|jgi:hypothetical protein
MSSPPPPMDRKLAEAGLVLALGAVAAFLLLDSPMKLFVGIPLLLGCIAIGKKAMPPQA